MKHVGVVTNLYVTMMGLCVTQERIMIAVCRWSVEKRFSFYLCLLTFQEWMISVFLCSHGSVCVQYFSMV